MIRTTETILANCILKFSLGFSTDGIGNRIALFIRWAVQEAHPSNYFTKIAAVPLRDQTMFDFTDKETDLAPIELIKDDDPDDKNVLNSCFLDN